MTDRWTNNDDLASILYLSGYSCFLSGSLIGCGRPVGGPGRTGWASCVRTVRHWVLSPCSSSPSPRDGSTGQEVAGPSGCPSSYWHCGSLSSCTEDKKLKGEEVSGQEGRKVKTQIGDNTLKHGQTVYQSQPSTSAESMNAVVHLYHYRKVHPSHVPRSFMLQFTQEADRLRWIER